MAFESGAVPEDWRSAVIAPLYKGYIIWPLRVVLRLKIGDLL